MDDPLFNGKGVDVMNPKRARREMVKATGCEFAGDLKLGEFCNGPVGVLYSGWISRYACRIHAECFRALHQSIRFYWRELHSVIVPTSAKRGSEYEWGSKRPKGV